MIRNLEPDLTAWKTFPTALGICGVSWNAQGITSFHLPDTTGKAIEKKLIQLTRRKKASTGAPPWVKDLIQKVKLHIKGEAQDFSAVPVSLNGVPEFHSAVYTVVQKIPSGSVHSYGEVAALLGKPRAMRAVGTAMAKNTIPLIVPCHRVIAASGKPGGFSAPGGLATKLALLDGEGVCLVRPATMVTPGQWRKAVDALKKQDADFATLMARIKSFVFTPKLHAEPLAVLVSSIVSQQLSTKVAATILQRVNALISVDGHPDARKLLQVSEAELRTAGLSRMKVAFLKDLAQKSVDGVLPSLEQLQGMSDEQIVRAFTKIKGIGRWSVEMFLIFNLGRMNVFPVLDFGVRKAIGLQYGYPAVPTPDQVEAYRKKWSPYCSVAALYLWRSLDND